MTADPDLTAALADYIAFYEGLTPESLEQLDAICDSEVRFRDPFNEVTGLAAYRAILADMFRRVRAPSFEVGDWALSGRVAYLRWTFRFTPLKGGAPWRIEGMSEVHFDHEGRVTAHLDHWDAASQFYARLPLLGQLIRLVQKRLTVA